MIKIIIQLFEENRGTYQKGLCAFYRATSGMRSENLCCTLNTLCSHKTHSHLRGSCMLEDTEQHTLDDWQFLKI